MDHSTVASVSVGRPSPHDFDKFLPWACREYSVDANVFINRSVQKSYPPHHAATSGLARQKSIQVKKSKKHSALLSTSGSRDNNSTSSKKSEIYSKNKIIIETVYNQNGNLVQLKILNNKAIPRKIMNIIGLIIPFYKYLTSISINSGLCMDALYEMSKFLPICQITELCLDGTFIIEANYHVLLMQSNLKHLSLAKCKLNDAAVKTITSELEEQCPASKVLSALNLSTNRITDSGAKYFADLLRRNRQLSYLNLAGNMITDTGGMSILDVLQKFRLTATEIAESRKRYVDYLKKRNDLISTLILELQAGDDDNKAIKKASKTSVVQLMNIQIVGLEKPPVDTDLEAHFREKAESMAESRMGLFNEAFCANNIEQEDGVAYCFGNNTLCYLNLAYNNLSYLTLKKLYEVISTQMFLNRTPRGLIKVVIEGNFMPAACVELEEIDKLLGSCFSVSSKKLI